MSGDQLDLSSDFPRDSAHGAADRAPNQRQFIGMQFACCGAYQRIYLNRQQTAYEGRCPKCAKLVRLKIGPGGTDQRFFTAF